MSGIFAHHRLECRGDQVAFAHSGLPGPGLSLHRLGYGAEVVVSAPALADFYLLQLTLEGACDITQGAESVCLRAGELLVINPTRPYRKRWGENCTQLIARLDRQLLEQAWTDHYGTAPSRPLDFAFRKAPTLPSQHLRFALGGMQAMMARGPDAARRLAGVIVASLPPDDGDRDTPAAIRLVRRAESFMDHFIAHDLAVEDIAQATGTTVRSLERGFRSTRDSTVVARLRRMRLERAHTELLAARDDGRSVTDIATSLGMLHPGRFSIAYKRQFGESPSCTLGASSRRRQPRH
jgi:AraC-like DNA-binding protein